MTEQDQDQGQEAEVISLHAGEDATVVHEAEIVDERGDRRPVSRRVRHAFDTRRLPRISDERRQRMADGAVRLHHRATPAVRAGSKTTAQAAVRHAVFVGAGVGVVRRRRRDSRSSDPYVRAMQQAEASGDTEAVERWADRIEQVRDRRHRRRMDWLTAPVQLAKALAIAGAVALAVLLGLGLILAVADQDAGMILEPIAAVITTIRWIWWITTAYGLLLATVGIAIGLAYLWDQGRKHGAAPGPRWAQGQQTGQDSTDSGLDEGMIMSALRNLNYPDLNRQIREKGWGTSVSPTWVQPPMPFNKHGWSFSLRLPAGVPASSINARKQVFAHNLGRAPEEVWINTSKSDPMAMEATVLNPGALRASIPSYPLLAEGKTDFWRGFPIGVDARHEPVVTQVFERNFVFAGIMGSGKSTQIMTLLAGAVLDPLVDIDVWCFADNNDYDWLTPVASVHMGDTDQNVQDCLDHVGALHDDLATRGRLLREHGIDAVTRQAAEKEPRLRPRVVVIDECQSLFRQDKPEDRREVINSLVRFYSAARKYGIVLAFATPTPSDHSLPRDLVAVSSNKSCFAIGDKNRNNVVLGERAHENGLSALGLQPSEVDVDGNRILNDVGTSVSVGFMTEPGILRSYHLTSSEREQVVQRGLELRGDQAPTVVAPAAGTEDRDLLEDVAAVVTGPDPIPAAQVAAALAADHPRHRAYQGLTKQTLAEALQERGVQVPATGNRFPVHADRVAEARRAQADNEQHQDDE